MNGEMKDYERNKNLEDIIANIDRNSSTKYNDKRFTKKHLNQFGRCLINTFDLQYKVKEKVKIKSSEKFKILKIANFVRIRIAN